jgi:hypothetical protein
MGNLELLELQPLSPAQAEMLSSIARGRRSYPLARAHRLLASAAPRAKRCRRSRSTT